MMRSAAKIVVSVCASLLLLCGRAASESRAAGGATSSIQWQNWADDIFERARTEKKLILLDLEAVWCHWCHVMDEQTYAKPEIVKIVAGGFIPVRVDQDSRPDLANRYRDYGWPATIILDGGGRELRKESGFIEPDVMVSLLKGVVADPEPRGLAGVVGGGAAPASGGALLAPEVAAKLRENHQAAFDPELGGLKTKHKFLEADAIEYGLIAASRGSERDGEIIRRTLAYNRKLLDPVWGGVYQYSSHGDWDHPHFEKIVSSQSANMRLYAEAFALWGDKNYLDAAAGIARYVGEFLTSPEGVFYTSQDADVVKGERSTSYFGLPDVLRRQQGIPAVDTTIYARENGWLIRALCVLTDVTGDPQYAAVGERAARWILANRALPDGGFRHGGADVGGPFLGDTLSMGRAFLALYASTAQREWLRRAEEAVQFIERNFVVSGEVGVVTAVRRPNDLLPPLRVVSENIELARFANLLGAYLGKGAHRGIAESALRYVGQPQVALDAIVESGVLLAAEELAAPPLHITVVGPKGDEAAHKLFAAAAKHFAPYKRVEWWDRSEGALPNPDVDYPILPKAAAFICTERRCSLPLFDPAKLPNLIAQLNGGPAKPAP